MVKVNTDVEGRPLPCELYLDGYVKASLDDLRQFVARNWDGIGFIVGYEGDGKSTFAQEIGLYLNANINLDCIVFNSDQFSAAVENANKGDVIIWDEADELGSNWASQILISIKRFMKRIRKLNLYILLVTPTIFDMNKYFAIHRTRFLFDVYSDGFERGGLRFFNRPAKKNLYIRGKKFWDMYAAKPNYIASFTKLPVGFPIDQDAYEAKKDEATKDTIVKQSPQGAVSEYRKACVVRAYRKFSEKGVKFTQADVAFIFDVHQTSISDDLIATDWNAKKLRDMATKHNYNTEGEGGG